MPAPGTHPHHTLQSPGPTHTHTHHPTENTTLQRRTRRVAINSPEYSFIQLANVVDVTSGAKCLVFLNLQSVIHESKRYIKHTQAFHTRKRIHNLPISLNLITHTRAHLHKQTYTHTTHTTHAHTLTHTHTHTFTHRCFRPHPSTYIHIHGGRDVYPKMHNRRSCTRTPGKANNRDKAQQKSRRRTKEKWKQMPLHNTNKVVPEYER